MGQGQFSLGRLDGTEQHPLTLIMHHRTIFWNYFSLACYKKNHKKIWIFFIVLWPLQASKPFQVTARLFHFAMKASCTDRAGVPMPSSLLGEVSSWLLPGTGNA
jgi:hypothetical protein